MYCCDEEVVGGRILATPIIGGIKLVSLTVYNGAIGIDGNNLLGSTPTKCKVRNRMITIQGTNYENLNHPRKD
jgi:hypothetical protein